MREDNQPYKILMTADTVGGVWTYCMDLCKALKGHAEIHLVTMGGSLKSWQQQEAKELDHVVVYETSFILEWMQHPWRDIEECSEWLLRLEDKIQPDIVHLNCYAYGSLPFKSPKIVVAHSDVYSWFLSVKKDDPPAQWHPYFRCVKKGLKRADLVLAPSEAMLNFVRNIYSIETGQVVYNGRNRQLFYAIEKDGSILSMGRIWDEAKNLKLLLDAAPLIEAPITIAGENQFAGNSFHLTHGNVSYTGKLSTRQVAGQLAKASVYVLPATYEPFGLSVLEAAFSGCALVLGDIESLHEIWQDKAFYVDPGDKYALADAVNYLVKNEDVRKHYAEQAYTHAQQYSAEIMGRKYLEIYRQLAKRKTPDAQLLTS
jgi:glycogen synthase